MHLKKVCSRVVFAHKVPKSFINVSDLKSLETLPKPWVGKSFLLGESVGPRHTFGLNGAPGAWVGSKNCYNLISDGLRRFMSSV
jgi:hypothetical protein